jgi:hypothetical protein
MNMCVCVCVHILQKTSLSCHLLHLCPFLLSSSIPTLGLKAPTAFCQKRILPFSKPTGTVKREAHCSTFALLYKAGVFIRTRKCGLSWHPQLQYTMHKASVLFHSLSGLEKVTLEQWTCCSLKTQLERNFCDSFYFLWCIRIALLQFLSLELIKNTILFYLFLFLLHGIETDKMIIFT